MSFELEEGFVVTAWAEAVVEGTVKMCRRVVQQCERHLRDLKDGASRGLSFAVKKATRAIRFCSLLRFWEGAAAGKRFFLEPWQAFIVGSLFGWMKETAQGLVRRFRTAWLEVPRKNGKSPLVAAIGLFLLVADGEAGAQIYSVATKRDQARIIFNHAEQMARKGVAQTLRGLDFRKNFIGYGRTAGYFRPLAQDAHTEDGLNVHGALFDEVHKYRDRKMWDVLRTAQVSRVQPLKICTTTAGDGADQMLIGYDLHAQALSVLDGIVENDSWFCFVSTLDEGDSWEDPDVWAKANPNWNVSVLEENVRADYLEAKASPQAAASFRRYYLNEWIYQAEKGIDIDVWKANRSEIDLETLKGRPCYGALDLSAKYDLSAFVLRFPPQADNERWQSLYFSFLPEKRLAKAEDRDGVPYRQWAVDGFLTPTPGNIIDYARIVRTIEEQSALYRIEDIGFDPWSATATALELQELGHSMVEMRQGMYTMAMPTKEYDAKIIGGLHNPGFNPIADWCASNIMWRKDSNDNFMPDKLASIKRIDLIVADIMAEGRAIVHEDETPEPSYLQNAELMVL